MSGRIQILDGGMGTTLEEDYPYEIKQKMWSAEMLTRKPQAVRNVHDRFVEAGATLITSCNYATNVDLYDSEEQGVKASRLAVELAHSACEGIPNAKVILGLGLLGSRFGAEYNGLYSQPYGPFENRSPKPVSNLQPSDKSYTKAMTHYHLDRLRVFSSDEATWDRIEMVGFETICLLNECEAIRKAMFLLEKEDGKTKPFYISYVFVQGKLPHARLETGLDVSVQAITRATFTETPNLAMPFGIGVNCTKPRYCMDIVKAFSQSALDLGCISSKTLLVYPDGGGLIYDPDDRDWKPDPEGDKLTPDLWAKEVVSFGKYALEAKFESVILGGCCMATPQHIKFLSAEVAKSDG